MFLGYFLGVSRCFWAFPGYFCGVSGLLAAQILKGRFRSKPFRSKRFLGPEP